jgi:imidazolonepropionase-like amidohydrolase
LGPQLHELTGVDDARRTVEFWADQGATSFKAYMHITRAELGAAIAAAHKRGLKVTGHLCSVTYREAAALGIDDLEHGFLVATDFMPGKKPDVCPDEAVYASIAALDPDAPAVRDLFRFLIDHHVAVTSTLPVFEAGLPRRVPPARVLELLAPEAAASMLAIKAQRAARPVPSFAEAFAKDLVLERAFARAGGVLLAGSDPTGIGGVLAGLADQREVELLVEAGFTPIEALRIASWNGARFLGEDAKIGTIEPGKQADLVVVRGDPSTKIEDIENVELVFKDGLGYDPARLTAPLVGKVGLQ